jgi:non-lysosomal glucosylceramidase
MPADLIEGTPTFYPAVNAESFSGFWITGRGWGIYRQNVDPASGEVETDTEMLYGELGDVVSSRTHPSI